MIEVLTKKSVEPIKPAIIFAIPAVAKETKKESFNTDSSERESEDDMSSR